MRRRRRGQLMAIRILMLITGLTVRVLAGRPPMDCLDQPVERASSSSDDSLFPNVDQPVERASRGSSSSDDSLFPIVNQPVERSSSSSDDSLFPNDIFSIESRQQGAVILHVIGLVYMFTALAIVCDEFFVPSLAVITEKLAISDDVAGATFMAAGGSAPEFFTSVFGVFFLHDNIGISTIVGSATFNILCVLACCTLFSHSVLCLTWWPLFRDVSFYIVALLCLVIFFQDESITWHEALTMFLIYLIYGIVMKYNRQLEIFVKFNLFRLKRKKTNRIGNEQMDGASVPVDRREQMERREGSGERRRSMPLLHSSTMFRTGLAHMALVEMEQTDGVDHETSRGGAIPPPIHVIQVKQAENNWKNSSTMRRQSKNFIATKDNLTVDQRRPAHHRVSQTTLTTVEEQSRPSSSISSSSSQPMVDVEKRDGSTKNSTMTMAMANGVDPSNGMKAKTNNLDNNKADDHPLDMSWPVGIRKQFTYLFLAPITFPLFLTLPDVRRPESRKWFIVTFTVSVLWIAFYSYLMVWWANTIGETLNIPTEIMGLTILAAGTSIPDLITRLPIPWLLFFGTQWAVTRLPPEPIIVSSNGLVCSVGMLFTMLVLFVAAVALCNWQMNKAFGVTMILSYALFCTISVFLETGRLDCPLKLTRCH